MSENFEISLSVKSTVTKDLQQVSKAFTSLSDAVDKKTKGIANTFSKLKAPITGVIKDIREVSKAVSSIKTTNNLGTLATDLKDVGTSANSISKPLHSIKTELGGLGKASNLGSLKTSVGSVSTSVTSLRTKVSNLSEAIRSLGKGHSLATFSTTLTKINNKVGTLNTKMKAVKTASNGAAKAIDNVGKASFGKTKDSAMALAASFGQAKTSISGLDKALTGITKKGASAANSMEKLADGAARVSRTTKGLTTAVDRTNRSVRKLSSNERLNKMERGLQNNHAAALGFKEGIDQVGFSLFKTQQSLTLIASLTGAAFAVSKALEFGRAMSEVATLLDGGKAQLREYKDLILDMSRALGSAPVETTKAMYKVLSLGARDSAEATKALAVSLRAARAGASELAPTVELLMSTANAYGISINDLEAVSDTYFTIVKGGNTTMSELATSMSDVTPTAVAMGVSLDETAAFLQTMTLNGETTSKATNKLRGVMTALIKDTPELNKIFSATGGAEATIRTKGLAAAMKLVTAETGGSVAALKSLLGTDEAVGAFTLTQAENYRMLGEAATSLAEKTGAMAAANKAFLAEDSARWDIATNSISVSLTSMGEIIVNNLLPTLELLAETIQSVVDVFTSMPILTDLIFTAFRVLVGIMAAKLISTIASTVLGFKKLAVVEVEAAAGAKALTVALVPAVAPLSMAGKVAKGAAISLASVVGVFKGLFKVVSVFLRANLLGLALTGFLFLGDALDALRDKFPMLAKAIGLSSREEIAAQEEKDRVYKASQETIKSYYKDHKTELMADKTLYAAYVKYMKDKTVENADAFLTLKRAKQDEAKASIAAIKSKHDADTSSSNAQLIKQIALYGVAAIAVEDFGKRVAAAAKSELSTSLTRDRNALKFLITDMKSLDKDTYTTKLVGDLNILGKKYKGLADIAKKEFANISLSAGTDLAKFKDVASNHLSKFISDTNAYISQLTTVYSQASNKLKTLENDRLTAASNAASVIAGIESTFLSSNDRVDIARKKSAGISRELAKARVEAAKLGATIDTSKDATVRQKAANDLETLTKKTKALVSAQKARDPNAFKGQEGLLKSVGTALIKANESKAKFVDATFATKLTKQIKLVDKLKESIIEVQKAADNREVNIRLKIATVQEAGGKGIKQIQEIISDMQSEIDGVSNVAVHVPMRLAAESKDSLAQEVLHTAENLSLQDEVTVSVTAGKSVDELTKEIDAKVFESAGRVTAAPIKVDAEKSAMTEMQKIREKFASMNPMLVKVKFKSQFSEGGLVSSLKAFATGGSVSGEGTGTSDSIPAMLSNGEFVMTAASVRQYGLGFMDMVNNMSLPTPAFAAGGLVTPPAPVRQHFSRGGSVATAPANDTVNLNLNVGGGSFAVQGARDQVNGLVDALRSVGQGAL